MRIEKNGIVLREITREDLRFLMELNNNSEINKTTVGTAKIVTMEQQIEWFDGLNGKSEKRLMIEKDSKTVGTCIINEIDVANKKCSIGIKIIPFAQGKGIGNAAIRTVIPYIFKDLKMHRIYVHILENNIASRKLFEKNGFKQEGIEMDSVYKNGNYNNLIIMGLINKK